MRQPQQRLLRQSMIGKFLHQPLVELKRLPGAAHPLERRRFSEQRFGFELGVRERVGHFSERGGGLLKMPLFTWLGLIAYLVFLVAYVPQIVAGSDEELCEEIQSHWVPEGPGIVGIVVVGWVNPLVAAVVGRAVRSRFTKTANCWGVDNMAKGTNTNRIVLFRMGTG